MENSLLLRAATAIVCPECKHAFSLEQGFAKQALESVAAASISGIEALKARERAGAERRLQEAAACVAESHKKALEQAQTMSQQRLLEVAARETVMAAREQEFELAVNEASKQAVSQLMARERSAFEQRLHEKETQLAELRSAELALRQDRQSVQDRAAALELEVARKLDAARGEIETTVRAREQERSSLREAEFQKTIADMHAKLIEAQRKAEQGSQQLQGEVLELAIEDGLRRAFPLDQIDEVKKGVRGGDVLQRVMTRAGQVAGVLLWETKRAKEWSPQWLAKLKGDMRQAGAELGVLVTTPLAIPKDWSARQTFGLCEGIWVTTWSPALQLAEVLRSGVLDCHKQRMISAGKGEKLEAVFDYLTSAHFGLKLRAVFETFEKMREELHAERNQTQQRWARRERQLESGMSCLLAIGGEIQGLAQQELPELELAPFKLAAQ